MLILSNSKYTNGKQNQNIINSEYIKCLQNITKQINPLKSSDNQEKTTYAKYKTVYELCRINIFIKIIYKLFYN